MQEKKLTFSLHENQLKVWEDNSRFRVLVAGRRFGKTTLAVTELVISALSKNEGKFWYVAPSYRQAKMIAWRLLKNLIPQEIARGCKFNESELSVMLPNGSLIELKGTDNEESLLGVGLDGMVVDEFASIYDNWRVWYEILRPMLTDKKGWVLFIGTPKGKDSFFELFLKGQREEDGYKSWQFKTVDNPFIDPKEVEEAKRDSPERYFKQEYEASFQDFVGLIYPEYSEKLHVIEPYTIPSSLARVGAIDPAMSGFTGVLKVAIDNEDLIVYQEYRKQDVRVSEVVPEIQEDGVYWLIDPASSAKSVQKDGKLYSLFDEYQDFGIVASPGENDVDAGINRVAEFFKTKRIRIFSTCTSLIWELERYHWAESKESISGQAKPKPFKKDDHLVDCLRYIVMSRPQPHVYPIEIKGGRWSLDWAERMDKRRAGKKVGLVIK